jgi:Ulp1 family protease
LPHQDNHHDCGLYTLAYIEFFSHHTPLHIHHANSKAFQAEKHLLKYFGPDRKDHPPFLTGRWFQHSNGIMLRFHLMLKLLDLMRLRAEPHYELMQDAIKYSLTITDGCNARMGGAMCARLDLCYGPLVFSYFSGWNCFCCYQ